MFETCDVDGYTYARCAGCGYLRLVDDAPPAEIEAIYSDSYFFDGVAGGYADYLSQGPLLRAHGKRYGQLLRRYGEPGKLLDVGSAAGFLLAGLRDCGWDAQGIDVNAAMCEWGHTNLNVSIAKHSLERFETDEQFAAVTMVQVIGHLFDIDEAFARASALTKQGGMWLIETWNARSLTARLLGAQWHELSPPSVRRVFTPESLASLAARHGMRQIAFGRPVKRVLCSNVKSLLSHKASAGVANRMLSRAMRLLPDGLEIPYPAEDLFWMLFRKLG